MIANFSWISSTRKVGFKSDENNSCKKKQVSRRHFAKQVLEDLMGGSSTVTQTAREDEIQSNGYVAKEDDVKVKKKKRERHSLFSSLRCCFGQSKRKPHFQDNSTDTWNCIDSKKPHFNGAAKEPSDEINDNSNSTGNLKYLLPNVKGDFQDKKCAIIDLDETLVHSSFKPISNADFVVPVEIDGTVHQVYVLKRPHVDKFLQRMGEMYECVLFTASLSKYADPVADLLDQHQVFSSRLFRDSCVFHRGNYVKDLSRLGRDLNKIIIIDNSPASYIFHPDNAVPVMSWFDDASDQELVNLIPFLEMIAESDDVYTVLRQSGFTSQANETTSAIQMQMQAHVQGPILQQQVITQVQQTDSEDENDSLTQEDVQNVDR